MKRSTVLGLAMVLALPVHAHEVYTHTHAVEHTHTRDSHKASSRTIKLSCYRGPWNDVIWDRPEGVFLDSLRALGYGPTEALAIGETVCRDRLLVGDTEGQKAKLREIIRRNPPRKG